MSAIGLSSQCCDFREDDVDMGWDNYLISPAPVNADGLIRYLGESYPS